jgi:hypothetical protein
LNYLARPERFELPTPWFVGCIAFAHKYLIRQDKIA